MSNKKPIVILRVRRLILWEAMIIACVVMGLMCVFIFVFTRIIWIYSTDLYKGIVISVFVFGSICILLKGWSVYCSIVDMYDIQFYDDMVTIGQRRNRNKYIPLEIIKYSNIKKWERCEESLRKVFHWQFYQYVIFDKNENGFLTPPMSMREAHEFTQTLEKFVQKSCERNNRAYKNEIKKNESQQYF